MAKEISYGLDARNALKAGVDIILFNMNKVAIWIEL